MDYDNSMDVNFTDYFLNHEPMDPLSPSIAPSETARERVEERIRQLQDVTARARQRQRQRQRYEHHAVGISVVFNDFVVNAHDERGIVDEIDDRGAVDEKKGRGCKRDSSHLVGKALALALMDSPVKKGVKEGGSFFDCNICMELARDPVLTCCGHLFCWPCFYQVDYIDSRSKECPVCKGEVSDRTVTPIYGNNGNESECGMGSDFKLPPRPKARRVKSARQFDD